MRHLKKIVRVVYELKDFKIDRRRNISKIDTRWKTRKKKRVKENQNVEYGEE